MHKYLAICGDFFE